MEDEEADESDEDAAEDDEDSEADDDDAEANDDELETRKKRKHSSGIDFTSLLVEKFPKVKTSGIYIFVDEHNEILTGTDAQHDEFFNVVFAES